MLGEADFDGAVRAAAFAYLDVVSNHGEEPVSWDDLRRFTFRGQPIHLVSQQGIFKPAALDLPISIRTAPPRTDGTRPYLDEVTSDYYLVYRYRGTDPDFHENRWLRQAMDLGKTLIYLQGVYSGQYVVHGANIIEDRRSDLAFLVLLQDILPSAAGLAGSTAALEADRRYYLTIARKRAHQAGFRAAVLAAYATRCALCRLRQAPLLDAAHILADAEGGPPVVSNGVAMCKIHHAAFDHHILGVRPDYVAEIRTDVLEEHDGPMLRHGLQELHGSKLYVPRVPGKQPDRLLLEARYERFRAAS
jgi:putative restriction endonuclease